MVVAAKEFSTHEAEALDPTVPNKKPSRTWADAAQKLGISISDRYLELLESQARESKQEAIAKLENELEELKGSQ